MIVPQRSSTPRKRHANVSRHASRPIDDLDTHPITTQFKIFRPKFIKLPWEPGQGIFPTGLLLIDRTTPIRKKRIWKTTDEHLGKAAVHGALNDRRRTFKPFFV